MDTDEVKKWLLEIIEEEFSPDPVPLGERWSGGKIVLEPNNDTQSKEIPLEVFFKKLMSERGSLRVLEQKINSHEKLSDTDKLTFQSYISKSYGSLTTFNILFKDGKDKFVGGGSGGKKSKNSDMTLAEAKKKLALNEYGGG